MSDSFGTPEQLLDFAATRGFSATLHRADCPTPTVQIAAEALGISVEAMTKNVVFLVKGQPVLVIARGISLVDKRVLARQCGVGQKKVKLASAEKTLAATGFAAGCVPPFGHKTPLLTFIDKAVCELERVYGGTSDPNVLISLPLEQALAITRGKVIEIALKRKPKH